MRLFKRKDASGIVPLIAESGILLPVSCYTKGSYFDTAEDSNTIKHVTEMLKAWSDADDHVADTNRPEKYYTTSKRSNAALSLPQ